MVRLAFGRASKFCFLRKHHGSCQQPAKVAMAIFIMRWDSNPLNKQKEAYICIQQNFAFFFNNRFWINKYCKKKLQCNMQHLQLTWSTVDKPEMQQNERCSKVNQFLQTTVRDPCTNVFWITATTQPGLANSGTAATETELCCPRVEAAGAPSMLCLPPTCFPSIEA